MSGTITFTTVTANDSDFKGQQPLGRQSLDNLSLNTPGNRGRILFSLDGECAFPFHYKNGTYYDCIKSKSRHRWCSLNETYEGYWKYCSAEGECPASKYLRAVILVSEAGIWGEAQEGYENRIHSQLNCANKGCSISYDIKITLRQRDEHFDHIILKRILLVEHQSNMGSESPANIVPMCLW